MRLGITSIQRDRAPWIKEWVVFHYLIGFRKFYIYLHQCSDDTEKILTELKKKFDLKIFTVDPNLDSPQLKCYQDAYRKFGDEVDWMAFIDADEFLFPTSSDTMENALTEFSSKKISALAAYWSVFGSNGYIEEPPGLIIENYRLKAKRDFEANRHVKSLVRGKQGESVQASDPHFFKTSLGTYDENLRPITYGWTNYQPTYKKFCVNHYTCQSRSYFLNFKKDTRGPDNGDLRNESWWQEQDRNEVLDHSMDKFVPPLKNILKSLE